MKLSANRAAKEAGVAKKTLLEAIEKGRLSAGKNDKGHWEIDPAELFRCFPKQGGEIPEKPFPTHHEETEKPPENSALAVEVKMLREQIDKMEAASDRERQNLLDQIDGLRKVNEEQRADFRQTLATLTDQRNTASEAPKRGLWARLTG